MTVPRSLPPSTNYHTYGAASETFLESQDETVLLKKKKDHTKGFLGFSLTDFMAMAVCFFAPLAMFSVTFTLISFYCQFEYPVIDWLLIALVFGIVVFAGMNAVKRMTQRSDGATDHWALWAGTLFLGIFLGYGLGLYFGWKNYVEWMRPYYSTQQLNKYTGVDASTREGSAFMDSGTITFEAGSHVDLSKSAGFRNLDMYCVAPIVSASCTAPGKCANYDFWAVGVNCCTGAPNNFACGETAHDIHAETVKGAGSAGLRLLSYTELPFYKFAVTQAATRYGIKTTHPIFVHYTTDASESLDRLHHKGWQGLSFALMCFGFFQLVVVAGGAAGVMIVKSKYV